MWAAWFLQVLTVLTKQANLDMRFWLQAHCWIIYLKDRKHVLKGFELHQPIFYLVCCCLLFFAVLVSITIYKTLTILSLQQIVCLLCLVFFLHTSVQQRRRFVLVLSSKFHPEHCELRLSFGDSEVLRASGVEGELGAGREDDGEEKVTATHFNKVYGSGEFKGGQFLLTSQDYIFEIMFWCHTPLHRKRGKRWPRVFSPTCNSCLLPRL